MVSHHGTFAPTYGRYEVRARIPSYAGKGLQETFWLWPVDMFAYGLKHPASGEIDFAELYSSYANLVIPVVCYQVCLTNAYKAWNATEQNPYVPFDKPFFLALAQLFGAAGNEFDPALAPTAAETEIDYVRVWR